MTEVPEIDLRYAQLEIGQELGVASFLLDAERVKQYRLLFGDTRPVKEGDPVPPFMLAMLCHRLLADQPKRPPGSIHVRQRSSFLGLAPVGTVYKVRGRVEEKWVKNGRPWVTFDLEGFLENGPVVYRSRTTSILGG
ncbi:MAG: hypothetical protein HPY81_08660 [Firmicutes bacterium]|nr:hypothetical protein [Bacillota bacterium]